MLRVVAVVVVAVVVVVVEVVAPRAVVAVVAVRAMRAVAAEDEERHLPISEHQEIDRRPHHQHLAAAAGAAGVANNGGVWEKLVMTTMTMTEKVAALILSCRNLHITR